MHPRKYAVVLLAAIIAMAATSASALAQSQQQSNWCAGKENAAPDLQIRACSTLIQSGQYSGKELADLYFRRAVAHVKKVDYDRAISDYNEALKIVPNFAFALINVGLAYCRRGDDALAIQNIKLAIELAPDNGGAHLQLASVYYKTGEYRSAIGSYDAFLKLQPDHPVGLYGRGMAKQKLNDTSAEADITAGEARDPDIGVLWLRYCVK